MSFLNPQTPKPRMRAGVAFAVGMLGLLVALGGLGMLAAAQSDPCVAQAMPGCGFAHARAARGMLEGRIEAVGGFALAVGAALAVPYSRTHE